MIIAVILAAALAASPGVALSSEVAGAAGGQAVFRSTDGRDVTLPGSEDVVGAPALSGDGRRLAFIRRIGRAVNEDEPNPTEVVLIDTATGERRILRPGSQPGAWPYMPAEIYVTFSPDGRSLYVEGTCPCTSDAIYRIDVMTGSSRRFAWGVDARVLREGPWRGDLLMAIHTCYASHPGCDYPVHVVTPGGKTVFVVPGSQGSDSAQVLARWLRGRSWRAW